MKETSFMLYSPLFFTIINTFFNNIKTQRTMKTALKVVGSIALVAGGFIAGATLAQNGTRIGIGAAGVGNAVAGAVSYPFRRPDAGRPNDGRPQAPNN